VGEGGRKGGKESGRPNIVRTLRGRGSDRLSKGREGGRAGCMVRDKNHRSHQLPADGYALEERKEGEEEGGEGVNGGVGGEEANALGGMRHEEEGEEEGGFLAVSVAEPAEEYSAKGTDEEGAGEDGEGFEEGGGRGGGGGGRRPGRFFREVGVDTKEG